MINIIVSVNSKYSEVATIFFEQFKKHANFKDVNVYIASDEDLDIDYPIKYKYINKEETIPGRIREIVNKEGKGYYCCFLADAFICKNLAERDVKNFLEMIEAESISYCNLLPKKNKRILKEPINKKQRYGVSFIAFIASYDFIIDEFKPGITDYDFEEKYLMIANEAGNGKFENMYILCNNMFHIEHGIVGGKWDRKTYKVLRKDGVQISNQIKLQSVKEYLFQKFARIVNNYFPNALRQIIKKRMTQRGGKFKTTL